MVADKPTTWFPRRWSDQDVARAVMAVLAGPKVARWGSDRGYLNVYGEAEGVRLKVRLQLDGTVHTAHPLDGDGVFQVTRRKDGTVKGPRALVYGVNREVNWPM